MSFMLICSLSLYFLYKFICFIYVLVVIANQHDQNGFILYGL